MSETKKMDHGQVAAKVGALSDKLDVLAYHLKGTKYDLNGKDAPDFKAIGDQLDSSIKALDDLVDKARPQAVAKPSPQPVPAAKT